MIFLWCKLSSISIDFKRGKGFQWGTKLNSKDPAIYDILQKSCTNRPLGFFVPMLWCTFFNHLSPITLARFEDKQDNTATRQHNQTNTGSVWDTLDNGHHSQLIFKCKEDHLKMINKLMASVWNSRKMAKIKKNIIDHH